MRSDFAAATTIVAALAPALEATMEHGRHHPRTRPRHAPWYDPRRWPIRPAPTPVDLVEVRPHLATCHHSPGDHDLTPTTHHGAFGAPFAPSATQHALA